MRKEIIIPDILIKDLKKVAFHHDKSVKKYMEDVVINDIKEKTKKIVDGKDGKAILDGKGLDGKWLDGNGKKN